MPETRGIPEEVLKGSTLGGKRGLADLLKRTPETPAPKEQLPTVKEKTIAEISRQLVDDMRIIDPSLKINPWTGNIDNDSLKIVQTIKQNWIKKQEKNILTDEENDGLEAIGRIETLSEELKELKREKTVAEIKEQLQEKLTLLDPSLPTISASGIISEKTLQWIQQQRNALLKKQAKGNLEQYEEDGLKVIEKIYILSEELKEAKDRIRKRGQDQRTTSGLRVAAMRTKAAEVAETKRKEEEVKEAARAEELMAGYRRRGAQGRAERSSRAQISEPMAPPASAQLEQQPPVYTPATPPAAENFPPISAAAYKELIKGRSPDFLESETARLRAELAEINKFNITKADVDAARASKGQGIDTSAAADDMQAQLDRKKELKKMLRLVAKETETGWYGSAPKNEEPEVGPKVKTAEAGKNMELEKALEPINETLEQLQTLRNKLDGAKVTIKSTSGLKSFFGLGKTEIVLKFDNLPAIFDYRSPTRGFGLSEATAQAAGAVGIEDLVKMRLAGGQREVQTGLNKMMDLSDQLDSQLQSLIKTGIDISETSIMMARQVGRALRRSTANYR